MIDDNAWQKSKHIFLRFKEHPSHWEYVTIHAEAMLSLIDALRTATNDYLIRPFTSHLILCLELQQLGLTIYVMGISLYMPQDNHGRYTLEVKRDGIFADSIQIEETSASKLLQDLLNLISRLHQNE